MARTFATSPGDVIRPSRGVQVRHFFEGLAQTFKRGALLIQGAATHEDEVVEGADNAVLKIVGIAAEDATGIPESKIAVYCAMPNSYFKAKLFAGIALDLAILGSPRALQKHALYTTTHPGVWVVDPGDLAADSFVPVKILKGEIGDFECEVEGRFIRPATIWGADA